MKISGRDRRAVRLGGGRTIEGRSAWAKRSNGRNLFNCSMIISEEEEVGDPFTIFY